MRPNTGHPVTASTAIARMRALAGSEHPGIQGMCLKTCQDAWGVQPRATSAIKAWQMTPPAHRHTDRHLAKVGAPHFFTGADGGLLEFGHIVLQSPHLGKVWSTDVPHAGWVGLTTIDFFEQVWHARYLGWTDWLEGTPLPLIQMPK